MFKKRNYFSLIIITIVFFVVLSIANNNRVKSFFTNISANLTCSTCGKISYYPEIDEKFGTVHASGDYPNLTDGNYLFYGSKEAYRLGFRTIELWMTPNVCSAHVINDSKKRGFYQTKKWCKSNTEIGFKDEFNTLTKLAKSEDFSYVLGMPFKNIIINIDSLNPEALTQSKVQVSKDLATKTERDLLYRQVYDFAKYLREEYRGTQRRFILVSTNELENRLTAYSGCNDNWNVGNNISCAEVPAGVINSKNAISFINVIQRAVEDARNDVKSNVEVFHSAEVSHVLAKKDGVKSGLTEVLPHTNADLYSYSAHEIRAMSIDENNRQNNDPYFLTRKALDKLEMYAPDSQVFGKKNLFIGEISINENLSDSTTYDLFQKIINASNDWGVKYFIYWALADSKCDKFGTTSNSDCKGLWIIKPDGSFGEVYNKIFTKYRLAQNQGQMRYGAEIESIYFDNQKINESQTINIEDNKDHFVKIRYKNTGEIPWKKDDGIFLSIDADSTFNALRQSDYQPSIIKTDEIVSPGQTYEFSIKLTSPRQQGVDGLVWQMAKAKLEKFGQKTFKIRFRY